MKREIAKKTRGYSSLLVIECDSDKLKSQQLSMAPIIDKIFSDFGLKKHKFIPINTKNDWLSGFADLDKEKQNYDVAVLIGHSNESIINVAQNFPIKWNILPEYLKTVKPKCLMLIACEAGQFLPSKAMFDGLPTLKELYGSPIITYRDQFYVLIIILLYILPNAPLKSIPEDIVNLLKKPDQTQTNLLLFKLLSNLLPSDIKKRIKNMDNIALSINYFINGGIVLRHTRNDYKKSKMLEEINLYETLTQIYDKLIKPYISKLIL